MLNWLQSLPLFMLFSLISATITAGLLVLSLLRPNRRGGWAFRLLAATLTLWQWAEFSKNDAVPRLDGSMGDFWTRISFLCVTLVAPTFLWMVLRMVSPSVRHWRRWLAVAYALSALLVLADTCGWVLGDVASTRYGIVHEPRPLFWLFAVSFVGFNAVALRLLYRGAPGQVVLQRRLRIVFWAAALGLGVGFLDVVTILWRPLFPVANLSAALYAVVLYGAVYRYNYWGGRGVLQELAVRMLWLGGGTLLFALVLHWGSLVVRYSGGVAEAALCWGLFVALFGPAIWNALLRWYRNRFPAVQSGPEMLLAVSRCMTNGSQASEMLVQVADLAQRHFHLRKAWGVLRPSDKDNVWEGVGGALSLRARPLLERPWTSPIGKRNLRDRLYYTEVLSREERAAIQRDWRLLRRLDCDIVVPVMGREGLEALLCFSEGRPGADSWDDYSRLLLGMGQILGDQLLVLRLGQERERERHLGELGLMAAGLAHEIKNPLEGVYGAAQILQEEGKGNARFVGMVLRESLRLNDVVHNFLRFARPYAVESTCQDIMPLLTEWSASGCLLDGPAAPVFAWVDATALHQILLNLVENAKRVQPPQIPLRIVLRQDGDWVECACVDQGGGVPSERIGKLFEPFQTGSPQGNGLGLALSRKMARAMGGDLTYRPVPGGAKFCLRLKKGS